MAAHDDDEQKRAEGSADISDEISFSAFELRKAQRERDQSEGSQPPRDEAAGADPPPGPDDTNRTIVIEPPVGGPTDTNRTIVVDPLTDSPFGPLSSGAPAGENQGTPATTVSASHKETHIRGPVFPTTAPGDGVPRSDADLRFARATRESNLVPADELDRCMADIEEFARLGSTMTLQELLVEKELLTESQGIVLAYAARKNAHAGILGGYQLIEKIGEGGMGEVHKAKQVALDRIVALKILPDRLASNPAFIGRFEREAQVAAKLDHPNVVRALDAGRVGTQFYFAMEFVEGKSLEDILEQRRTLPEEEALGIVIQAARGLECAWRNGLVHRDVKPDNLLVTEDGITKLADLGLAKGIEGREETRLTQDGAVMGTPLYVSPEQARGKKVDTRSDIYSLGIVFYRMVTGEVPFTGEDAVSIIMARFEQPAKPANEVHPGVSDDVAQVIATMMATDRKLRYPDPAVLLHDLERLAAGDRPQYAGAKEAERRRAVDAAQKRHMATGLMSGTIVIRRRHRKEIAIVAAGLLLAVAVAGLATVLVLRDDGPDHGDTSAIDEEVARRRKLEEEAAAFYAEVNGDFDAGRHAEVVRKVVEAGDRFDSTDYGTRLEALRKRATAAMLEAEARGVYAEVEKDFGARKYEAVIERVTEVRDKYVSTSFGPKLDSLRSLAEAKLQAYESNVRLAREALELGDYATAIARLDQAKAIKETDELDGLYRQARRLQYLANARAAERDGRMPRAVELYRLALDIEGDAELAAHVEELERRIALATRLREAKVLAAAEKWQEAKDAYTRALELARDDEAEEIKPELQRVERELRYARHLASARAAADATKWRTVLAEAGEAQTLKPEEPEPKELILRARRALGPPRETTDSIGMQFVLVNAGEFTMGGERGDDDEKPEHTVHLDAYYIARFEVTNAQFEEFDADHRHRRTEYSPEDAMPVVAVSWRDAAAFCSWLSEKEGVEYRLPTEAQWEKAARGTVGRAYPWGSAVPGADGAWRCNFASGKKRGDWSADGHAYASPVGAYPNGASPYGVHDLAGNVWEWCLDWYASDYYSIGEATNPTGPSAGRKRILRGGSFANNARQARSGERTAEEPGFAEGCVGFRCARMLDPIFREETQTE